MIRLFSKISYSLILIFFISLYVTPEASAQQADTEHVVQQGETLFSISRQYDVTVSELRLWNQLDTDDLQTGQVLRLTPPSDEDRVVHVVEPGESLFGISRNYNVTIAEIQQWNNLDGTAIDSGTELIIYIADEPTEEEPLPPTIEEIEEMDEEERTSIVRRLDQTPAGSDTYVVRSGDTLFQIAREHDMTVNELRELNNLQDDMLRVGQRIMVKSVRTAPSVAEGAEDSTPQGKFALYRVQSGENMNTLLQRFRMSRAELEALNPGVTGSGVSQGQQLTVLLPPTRNFDNPYRADANLENLGTVPVTQYSDGDRAAPTTSGELYNPSQLTAAHSNMALGNIIYIENPRNGKGVYVRVNDRQSGDGLKLSHKAYEMLGFTAVEQPQVTIYLDE